MEYLEQIWRQAVEDHLGKIRGHLAGSGGEHVEELVGVLGILVRQQG